MADFQALNELRSETLRQIREMVREEAALWTRYFNGHNTSEVLAHIERNRAGFREFWDRHEALHQTRLAESSSAYGQNLQDALNGLQALGVSGARALGILSQGLVHQAYLLSTLDFFWITGWITLAPIALVWLTRRPRRAAVAAGE